MNTTDLWEEPHAVLENGFQLKNKSFTFYGGFLLDFYRYMNRNFRNDRLDGTVRASLNYHNRDWILHVDGQFYVFGTPGEYNLNANLRYKIAPKISANITANVQRIFPEFFQLNYLGNRFAYNYNPSDFDPSQCLNSSAKLSLGEKQVVTLGVDYSQVNNLYVFDSLGWNDGTNQNFLAPNLDLKVQAGIFNWNGSAKFYFGNKASLLLPDFMASTRVYLNASLFKAKRLKIATGAEFQYFNGLPNMLYFPELGLFSSTSLAPALPPTNLFLNAFVNIEIDRFRFFINANRINQLFEPNVTALVRDYPVRPFFIRMGLTWDFIN
jgi:hypothetical protein